MYRSAETEPLGVRLGGRAVSAAPTFDFSGARVLVTGGTAGIGHAIAGAFADAGATVTITGTRADAPPTTTPTSPGSGTGSAA